MKVDIQQDLKQLTSYLVPPRLISPSLVPMILPTYIILFQHQQTETGLAQPIFYSSIIVRGPDHNNIYPYSSQWKSCNIRSTLVALWPLEKPVLYWLVNLRIAKHFVLVRVRWGLNINLIIISIIISPIVGYAHGAPHKTHTSAEGHLWRHYTGVYSSISHE